MKLISLKCDACHGELEIDQDNLIAYCPYCGHKLLIDIPNIHKVLIKKEKTKFFHEFTKIEQEKTKREEEKTKRELLKYEYKERRRIQQKEEQRKTLINLCIMFGITIVLLLGFYFGNLIYHSYRNEIRVRISSSELEKMEYFNAQTYLEEVGFSDISVVPVNDIIIGLFAKENLVRTVSINGNEKFTEYAWFPQDAVIIITYHTKE